MLVPAGPEVPMATPTLPVMRAQPSATCVPPSSWRTIRCSICRTAPSPCRAAGSPRPGSRRRCRRPRDFRTSTTASMTGISASSGPSRDRFSMTLQQRGVVERSVALCPAGRDELGDQAGDRQRDAGLAGRGERDAHVLVVQVDRGSPAGTRARSSMSRLQVQDPVGRQAAGEHVEAGLRRRPRTPPAARSPRRPGRRCRRP